jgi:hypothetical protein
LYSPRTCLTTSSESARSSTSSARRSRAMASASRRALYSATLFVARRSRRQTPRSLDRGCRGRPRPRPRGRGSRASRRRCLL